MVISSDLLSTFKKSIGDLSSSTDMDNYYKVFLNTALVDLSSDDISDDRLNSELGISLTIIYAEALMNKEDVATNPTITLLRNKLSILTKGDRAYV